MAFTTAFTACPATAWFSSVARATFSISSDWFISDLQLQRYETPTLARAGLKSESGPDTFGDFQFDELVAAFFPFAMEPRERLGNRQFLPSHQHYHLPVSLGPNSTEAEAT